MSDVYCLWVDRNTIAIDSSELRNLQDYANFGVRGSTIKPQCVSSESDGSCDDTLNGYAPALTLPVMLPNITEVRAVLTFPSRVSVFDDSLYFYLEESLGVGALGVWDWYQFSVNTNTTGAATAAWKLQRYLNSLSPRVSPHIEVPTDLRQVPGVYAIELTLCNTVGNCGKDYGELTIHQGIMPFADILGRQVRTVYRSSSVLFKSYPQPMKTYDNTTAAGGEVGALEYSWKLKSLGSSTTTWMDITNTASNPVHNLKLAAYTFPSAGMYLLELTVYCPTWDRTNVDSHFVHVFQPDIIAMVTGAETRSLVDEGTLTLTASELSYDLDEGAASSRTGAHLAYAWMCTETLTSPDASNCPFDLVASGSGSVEVTPKTTRIVDSGYVVVTVYDSADPTRFDTDAVLVNVASTDLPVVRLLSDNMIFTDSEVYKINVDDALRIEAQIAAPASGSGVRPVVLEWYMDEDESGAALGDVATSPYSKLIPARSPSSFILGMSLALKAGSFAPGIEFTLELHANTMYSYGGVYSTDTIASITVTINDPPVSGDFSVAPDQGNEISTVFTMTCLDWLDDDLPINYVFGYWGASSRVVPVSSATESTSIDAYLPYVDSTAHDGEKRTVARVRCFDSLFAESAKNFTVTVTAQSSVSSGLNSLRGRINSIDTSDPDQLTAVVAVGAGFFNRANCSKVSEEYCQDLNRFACSTMTQTCGPCFDYIDFVGERGHRNTACIYMNSSDPDMLPFFTPSPTAYNTPAPTPSPTYWANRNYTSVTRQRALQVVTDAPTSAPTSSPTAIPCGDSGGCAPWQVCQDHGGIGGGNCVYPNKTCPANCSNDEANNILSGGCSFYAPAAAVEVPSCGINNDSCISVCYCYFMTYGGACEFSNHTEYEAYKEGRALLLAHLVTITETEEPSRASVGSWLSNLQELSERPDQLGNGNDTTSAFYSVSSAILHQATALSIPYSSMDGLTHAIDGIAGSQEPPNGFAFGDGSRRLMDTDAFSYSENSFFSEVPRRGKSGRRPGRALATNTTVFESSIAQGYDIMEAAGSETASDYAAIVTELAVSYAELVMTQVTEGEDAIEVIGESFRFRVEATSVFNLSERAEPSSFSTTVYSWSDFSYSSASAESSDYSEITFRSPISHLEKSINMIPYKVSVLADLPAYAELDSEVAATVVSAAVVVVDASLYQNPNLTAHSVEVIFGDMPCPITGCEYVIELPNYDNVDLSRHNINPLTETLLQNYTLSCDLHSTANATFTCSNGEKHFVNCTGEEGDIFVDCPHYQPMSRCMSLQSADNALYNGTGPGVTCSKIDETEERTYCHCVVNGTNSALPISDTDNDSNRRQRAIRKQRRRRLRGDMVMDYDKEEDGSQSKQYDDYSAAGHIDVVMRNASTRTERRMASVSALSDVLTALGQQHAALVESVFYDTVVTFFPFVYGFIDDRDFSALWISLSMALVWVLIARGVWHHEGGKLQKERMKKLGIKVEEKVKLSATQVWPLLGDPDQLEAIANQKQPSPSSQSKRMTMQRNNKVAPMPANSRKQLQQRGGESKSEEKEEENWDDLPFEDKLSRLVKKKRSINTLEGILDATLPRVFREKGSWERLACELVAHHRWLNLFFDVVKERFPDLLDALDSRHHIYLCSRVASAGIAIFTPLLVMMGILQFADPDDGYCEGLRFSDLCEAGRSQLVADVDISYGVRRSTRCYWDDDKCYPNQPTNLLSICAIAFAALLFATPVSATAEYVFNRILGLPQRKVPDIAEEDPHRHLEEHKQNVELHRQQLLEEMRAKYPSMYGGAGGGSTKSRRKVRRRGSSRSNLSAGSDSESESEKETLVSFSASGRQKQQPEKRNLSTVERNAQLAIARANRIPLGATGKEVLRDRKNKMRVQLKKRENELLFDPPVHGAFKSWWHLMRPSAREGTSKVIFQGHNYEYSMPYLSQYLSSILKFDMNLLVDELLAEARQRHLAERALFEYLYLTKKQRNQRLLYVSCSIGFPSFLCLWPLSLSLSLSLDLLLHVCIL
jgi:hypothetical protein